MLPCVHVCVCVHECVCACACVCVCVCMCVCIWGRVRDGEKSDVSLNCVLL